MLSRLVALPVLVALGVAACGSHAPGADDAEGGPTGALTVLAAASLRDAFERLRGVFEDEHPGVTVTFAFAGSSTLAQQVLAGAPADVLATASTPTMALVGDLADEPVVVARNTLEIVVPVDNPAGITSLADLADPGVTLALCAPEVPCGAAAADAFAAAGITPTPDTYEKDVTAALTRAVLGEVDAALVYRTDVLAAGESVRGIPLPDDVRSSTDYPVAVLTEAPNPDAARAFVALVRSAQGRQVLTEAGFEVP
ncbi:molybdate ABC transporter substrate-binding protein [Cellulomonas triticagri]|uniref:molybdate ABC transporter substrate-binding protein n=1 Tax=Cellulomonas triticagri TaxID=2483352 RepID=UPI001F230C6A|nr:molybdate ABC transporter substrate-binding protein [Cellulomonas triticagri]